MLTPHVSITQRFFLSTPSANLTVLVNIYNHCHTLLLFQSFLTQIINIINSCFSMKTVLFRTGSGSIPAVVPGSQRAVSVSTRESIGKVFNGEKKKGCSSPMISLYSEVNRRGIRRVSSDSDVIRSGFEGSSVTRKLSKIGSRSLSSIIPEEDCGSEQNELEVLRSIGSLSLTEDRRSYAGDWHRNSIPVDELGFSGGGIGSTKNKKFGGNGDGRDEIDADSLTGGKSDPRKIGAYYKEMLNSDPMNPLLLRNYGKYLHEVSSFSIFIEIKVVI